MITVFLKKVGFLSTDKLFVHWVYFYLGLLVVYYKLLEFGVHSQLHERVKLFSDARPKQRLNGYEITSKVANGKKQCAVLCQRHGQCNSFNFCAERLCELNFATTGDVNRSSWADSELCDYSGTPDHCTQRDPTSEICRQQQGWHLFLPPPHSFPPLPCEQNLIQE